MTPTLPLRLAVTVILLAIASPACTRLLQPDPLNKTTSIVNGTQVTRGPSRGPLASGFATTDAPLSSGGGFEPSVGDPFDVEALSGLSANNGALPELQGIDFGAEQAMISDIASSGTIPTDERSAAYFLSEIGQSVYFSTDSSELNDRARDTLRRQAAWLNVNPDVRVMIEGHADERGTREYNLALGDRRASATQGYLIAVGVDESRLDKISYGKERPVSTSSDSQAWSQNRRTETVIEGGGDAFASNPFDAEPLSSGTALPPLETAPMLSPVTTTTMMADDNAYALPPLMSGTSDSRILNPLFPDTGTTALISPPGQINYETTSGLYAPVTTPVQTQVFDTGTIAPSVFDSGTLTPAPVSTTPTSTTRIEDVSVDDLLRDPSLIDRIGTPGSVPGS